MESAFSNNRHFGIRGFPKACICGRPIALFTSKTQDNPGRPFYRCETQRNDHYFRWVEECMLEELKDVIAKIEVPHLENNRGESESEGLEELVLELSQVTRTLSRDFKRLKLIAITTVAFILSVIVALVYFKLKNP